MSDLDSLIQARILQADLKAVDERFAEIGISDMAGIIFLKGAIVALANVRDIERSLRPTYEDHPELAEIIRPVKKNLEFVYYLRNKFVGHIHRDLIDKALEWKPELRYLAPHLGDSKAVVLTNIFVLETAINTYVDKDQRHKVFESETDLAYPPDMARFLAFLEVSVRTSIDYLDSYCATISKRIAVPDPKEFDLELWLKAGKTKFGFLAKRP